MDHRVLGSAPDLAAVFAALPTATAVFAADAPRFTVLAASDALLAASHQSRDAVIGRPLAEAFPNASPEDPHASGLAELRTSIAAAVRTGTPQHMERQRYDLPRPNGTWEARYWDAVNIPVFGADGAVRHVLHQTADVTAQVQGAAAAERAASAERRAERILERMGDAHCVLDRDFRLVAVNAAAERLLGRPRDLLLGRTHWEVFPASFDAPIGQALRRAAGEGVEQHLVHHYAAEGYDLHLEVDLYPTDEGGLAMFWRDVTDRVRAEQTLKESDRRKDEFLATLAHELRNPLAPISNALQFLRHPNGKRRADRVLAMVERQVRHMVRLVDDLMDVTRISRGKVELRRAPVVLADILNSVVETSLPAFEQKRQHLEVDTGTEALRLDADKVRLTQVFANLLNNAAKYTPQGGQVWLAVRREGHEVVVTVRDTGMGMRAEQLPLIFEMFSQPHARNGHSDSGLGIGLAMVRSLVELHGGTVRARSDGPGTGSEFTVRLPLVDGPAAVPVAPTASVAAGAAPLAGRRILVVDDNRDAADSLCQVLAAHGAATSAAYDGHEALHALDTLETAPPHAVVLDIGMPGMDGYEAARRIRARHLGAHVTLVALSGWGQDADRERSQASGFDYHLTKPAELETLLRILAGA